MHGLLWLFLACVYMILGYVYGFGVCVWFWGMCKMLGYVYDVGVRVRC